MRQQTLQLYEDCLMVERILSNKEISDEIVFAEKRVKRRFNTEGYPLVHAREIYSKPEYGITEKRAIAALNELVRQKKAEICHHAGLIWYSLTPEDSKCVLDRMY